MRVSDVFLIFLKAGKKGLFYFSLEQVPARFCTLQFFGDVMRTHAHPQALILLFTLPKQPLWHMLSALHFMEFKRPSQIAGLMGLEQGQATHLFHWMGTRNMCLKENHKKGQTQLGHHQREKSLQRHEFTLKTRSHLSGWNLERGSILLQFLAHGALWRQCS